LAAPQALAADGVTQSAVLLKNDKGALPLSKGRSVALIGPTANLSRSMAAYYGPGVGLYTILPSPILYGVWH